VAANVAPKHRLTVGRRTSDDASVPRLGNIGELPEDGDPLAVEPPIRVACAAVSDGPKRAVERKSAALAHTRLLGGISMFNRGH
jgi:hypothetical protein